MEAPWGPMLEFTARLHETQARGAPFPPADAAFPMARALAPAMRDRMPFYVVLGVLGFDGRFPKYRLEVLDRIREAGIYPGDLDVASTLGEGMLRISRGDWTGGLRALRRTEGSSLMFGDRMTSARLACLGAWLGAVDVATADSTLRRVRALPRSDESALDRAELHWLDGLVGVIVGDGPRVERARRELAADTMPSARNATRSLTGLWLARSNADAGADTLKASTDLVMREGGSLPSVMAIDRLVVARALRKRGSPAEAERYLMWPDASSNVARNSTVRFALTPLVSYERGVAFDEAGDRRAAAFWLQRFVQPYDQPPDVASWPGGGREAAARPAGEDGHAAVSIPSWL